MLGQSIMTFLMLLLSLSALAGDEHWLTIQSPDWRTLWYEGDDVEIRWQTAYTGTLCIEMVMGGKPRGILNDCRTPASAGRFRWHVDRHFVTGFGLDYASNIRVALYPSDHTRPMVQSRPFTIAGFKPVAADSAEEAIAGYYAFLDQHDYDDAFALRSPFRITLRQPGGETLNFPARGDFYQWQERITKSLQHVKVESIMPIAHSGGIYNPRVALGIQTFKVSVTETLKGFGTRQTDYFVDVVRGSDGFFRILNIGSGP